MWVYTAAWIIQDGAPELGRDSILPGVGLRADCLSVGPAGARVDGLAELMDRGRGHRPRGHLYDLTGAAGAAHDVYAGDGLAERHAGSEFLLTCDDQVFTAQAAAPASQIPEGSRVTARCMLSVVADYEWDAFGLPDLRRDWHVLRLKIEHLQVEDPPDEAGQAFTGPPGKVIRSHEIEHMSRWDDDRDPTARAWYVLDLLPVQAP